MNCKWCGEATSSERRKLCDSCKDMSDLYRYRIAHMFRSTPVGDLIRFRNVCMDMINLREHGGVGLPADLDYQLERVNSYLNRKDLD